MGGGSERIFIGIYPYIIFHIIHYCTVITSCHLQSHIAIATISYVIMNSAAVQTIQARHLCSLSPNR